MVKTPRLLKALLWQRNQQGFVPSQTHLVARPGMVPLEVGCWGCRPISLRAQALGFREDTTSLGLSLTSPRESHAGETGSEITQSQEVC